MIKIRSSGKEKAEILLYEEIGDGWFGGTSAKQFADALQSLGDISQLDLRINSPGGSVFDGMTIYSQLSNHSAHVNVYIDGLAASIASIIAMAGDEINIADNAMIMIHEPWTHILGSADDLRHEARVLDAIRGNMVGTYAKRTQAERAAVSRWMKAETWFTAAEAIDSGFADQAIQASSVAAAFDCSRYGYRNIPGCFAKPKAAAVHKRSVIDCMNFAEIEAYLRDADGFTRAESKRLVARTKELCLRDAGDDGLVELAASITRNIHTLRN